MRLLINAPPKESYRTCNSSGGQEFKLAKGCVTGFSESGGESRIENASPCDGDLVLTDGVCVAEEIDDFSCYCKVGFAGDLQGPNGWGLH